jgi:hypothetical protein
VARALFEQRIADTDFLSSEALTRAGFRCLLCFFCRINEDAGNLHYITRPATMASADESNKRGEFVVSAQPLLGLEVVWSTVCTALDPVVATRATGFLTALPRRLVNAVHAAVAEDEAASATEGDAATGEAAPVAEAAAIDAAAVQTDRTASAALKLDYIAAAMARLRAVGCEGADGTAVLTGAGRCLGLLRALVDASWPALSAAAMAARQTDELAAPAGDGGTTAAIAAATFPRDVRPHVSASRGVRLDLELMNNVKGSTTKKDGTSCKVRLTGVRSGDTVAQLHERVAVLVGVPPGTQLRIFKCATNGSGGGVLNNSLSLPAAEGRKAGAAASEGDAMAPGLRTLESHNVVNGQRIAAML